MGTDRLGGPRVRGSNRYTVDYLSRTADGRILFPEAAALPLRLAHTGRVRPARANPRDAAPMARSGSSPRRRAVHPRVGAFRRAPRLDADDVLRPGEWRRDRPRATPDRGRYLNLWPDPGGPHPQSPECYNRFAYRQPRVTSLGARALRWLGARYVQRGLTRVDDRAESTGEPPTGKTLAERLGKH